MWTCGLANRTVLAGRVFFFHFDGAAREKLVLSDLFTLR